MFNVAWFNAAATGEQRVRHRRAEEEQTRALLVIMSSTDSQSVVRAPVGLRRKLPLGGVRNKKYDGSLECFFCGIFPHNKDECINISFVRF